MGEIPPFNKNELWVIEKTLEERYGQPVETEIAEAELRLNPHSTQLNVCPTLFWQAQGANFAIFKTGEGRYRSMFYYSIREQYGTGIDEYTDLTECVVTLLQVQADHEADRRKAQGE